QWRRGCTESYKDFFGGRTGGVIKTRERKDNGEGRRRQGFAEGLSAAERSRSCLEPKRSSRIRSRANARDRWFRRLQAPAKPCRWRRRGKRRCSVLRCRRCPGAVARRLRQSFPVI